MTHRTPDPTSAAAALRAECDALRAEVAAAVDALRAEERDVATGLDPYSEGGRYVLGYRDGLRRALAALRALVPAEGARS